MVTYVNSTTAILDPIMLIVEDHPFALTLRLANVIRANVDSITPNLRRRRMVYCQESLAAKAPIA